MVEWKKLGDICDDVIVPMRDRPKIFDGTIPWCRIEDIEGMFFNKSLSGLMVSEEVIKKMNLKVYPTGTVICSCSATLGVCAINTQPLITNQTFIGLVCSNQIINRFLYYYMLTRKKELLSLSTTGTIPYVSREKFEKMMVPVPSISEQNRIVGILDTFTASIENLKEQITQRRKQFEHYRDQLLDLEGKEGVEMKTLGDVGEICMCKRIMKDQTSDKGDIPFFKIGTFGGNPDAFISKKLFEDYKSKYSYPKKGEILISASGTIGRSVVFDGEDAYFQDSNIVWIANDEKLVTNRYLYYFYQIAEWRTDGGTIKRLYNYNLKNTTIYVPCLTEQSRIVSILDTFEASIQNLEAQLSQREKQYEYYRNILLTFE